MGHRERHTDEEAEEEQRQTRQSGGDAPAAGSIAEREAIARGGDGEGFGEPPSEDRGNDASAEEAADDPGAAGEAADDPEQEED